MLCHHHEPLEPRGIKEPVTYQEIKNRRYRMQINKYIPSIYFETVEWGSGIS
jgi:hypothetical protein